jgi:hypothetical protein
LFRRKDKQEFARLRLEAIAAAFLEPDGSALERPPVGVGGKSTSSVTTSSCHLPLKGKARKKVPKAFPFRGRWRVAPDEVFSSINFNLPLDPSLQFVIVNSR